MVSGDDVVQSAMINPFEAPSAKPSLLRTRSSTFSEPPTHRNTASQRCAISRADPTSTAPRLTTSSTAARFRCAMMIRGWPALRMFTAMPCPIFPSPTNPTAGRFDSPLLILVSLSPLSGIRQYVARPPDRSKTAPVVNEFSSEASQQIIAEASSSSRKRPRGIFDSM